jgi:hypothetical protein
MHNLTENIYNLDSIIQHFEKSDAIAKLLKQHNIAKIKSVEMVQRYQKDENRSRLLITGKEQETGQTEKILIDYKLGEPCIDQVYDAIYEIGKDCSKRIIMFGGVGKNEVLDPATNESVVESLITGMNDYPLNLYLVKLDCNKLETELRSMDLASDFFYTVIFSINDLHSEERFREEEFWEIYYDYENMKGKDYSSKPEFFGPISNKFKYGKSDFGYPVEFAIDWFNDGAFLVVTQRNNKTDYLKEFWKTRKDELQQLSQNNETRFTYTPGKFPRIASKVWNFPLKCLVSATNAEKMEFAKLLHSQFHDLYDLYDLKKF